MDRIRQALDRAREERREAVASAALPPARPARADAPDERRSGPRAHAPGLPADDGSPGATRPASAVRARLFDVSPLVLEQHRIVIENTEAPATRSFGMLRTEVLQRMRERGWRTLGVVGARRGDGKTTIAVNLALAIARSPRETALLVDLDLRRPSVAPCFGLVADVGVEDVLSGERALPDCLYRPRPFGDFTLLPARGPVRAASELVAGVRCQEMIAELRARYADRIVVLDLPPALEVDDTAAIAPLLDCLLVVVAEFRTARDDVARVLQLLARTPVVGTVLNRSLETMASEAYG